MMKNKQRSEPVVPDVHKTIKAAFEAFDYESNNRVDVREIGTIIYSLGCFPTQADLHDKNSRDSPVQVEDQTGCINLEKFLPAMTKVLMEHKFPSVPEDLLLQAFEVLDKENKGYLEPEQLAKYMTQEGKAGAFSSHFVMFHVCFEIKPFLFIFCASNITRCDKTR
uniref:EF-hand domain-containing protein n=1 Tax=Gasterosteus aculeatus aculeatus TaxID=481459 RepID=G3PNF2_GASAC